MSSVGSEISRESSCSIRYGIHARFPKNSGFLVVNISLVAAICGIFIYFRWDDLDFISYPKLYEWTFVDKPPLALLMYLPMVFFPAIAGQAIYFGMVITVEALLLRWLFAGAGLR